MSLYDKFGNSPTKGASSVDYDDEPLVAKCGEIKVHHWARKTADPDTWHEPETQWHLEWKSHFNKKDTEQVITVDGMRHRMDARMFVDDRQVVIEFQHSHISPQEIRERERGYGNMVWIFDCNGKWEDGDSYYIGGEVVRISWKRPRQSILYCNQPVMLENSGVVWQVVAMPEYKNDYWYAVPCRKEQMTQTLSSGVFELKAKVLEKLIKGDKP